jgi:tripartite-type tricarboxylate transporter receptor subunit TctC
MLAASNGIRLEAIRYKSEPDAMADLLAGRVALMNATSTSVLAHVKAGRLRALSTAFDARSPLLPDVPSILEAGLPKFPISPWFALVGPAELPSGIVAAMNKAMAAVLAKPSVKEQMQQHGFMPRSSTPSELATYMKDQLAVWKAALRDARIDPQ